MCFPIDIPFYMAIYLVRFCTVLSDILCIPTHIMPFLVQDFTVFFFSSNSPLWISPSFINYKYYHILFNAVHLLYIFFSSSFSLVLHCLLFVCYGIFSYLSPTSWREICLFSKRTVGQLSVPMIQYVFFCI